MAPQSVGDFGVLHRASVTDVEQIGPTQAVWVECPTIAPGKVMGPLSSLAPDLGVGERVLISCIGASISDVVVLQRWTPRWPNVTEVPGLDERLRALASDNDLDLLADRVERTSVRLDDTVTEVRELDRSLGYARSKIEELPEAFQRQRAESDSTLNDAIRAMRTVTFGGPDRTRPPTAFVYWVADSGTLAAGGNYLMTSGWAKEDTDPDNMITLGSSGGTTIVAPVLGKYVLEWDAVSTATSGALYARHSLNPDTTATLASQVGNSSVTNFAQLGAPEATHLHGQVTRNLAANDRIQATLYSTVAFVLKAGWFGQLRQTRWGIRYVGPAQT